MTLSIAKGQDGCGEADSNCETDKQTHRIQSSLDHRILSGADEGCADRDHTIAHILPEQTADAEFLQEIARIRRRIQDFRQRRLELHYGSSGKKPHFLSVASIEGDERDIDIESSVNGEQDPFLEFSLHHFGEEVHEGSWVEFPPLEVRASIDTSDPCIEETESSIPQHVIEPLDPNLSQIAQDRTLTSVPPKEDLGEPKPQNSESSHTTSTMDTSFDSCLKSSSFQPKRLLCSSNRLRNERGPDKKDGESTALNASRSTWVGPSDSGDLVSTVVVAECDSSGERSAAVESELSTHLSRSGFVGSKKHPAGPSFRRSSQMCFPFQSRMKKSKKDWYLRKEKRRSLLPELDQSMEMVFFESSPK